MRDRPALLNVAHSATGRRWAGPEPEVERLGLALVQRTGLPEIVAHLLAARGVGAEGASGYLAPTLRSLMPDPSTLTDMDRAAERLVSAVLAQEKIAVFGDYDVDGAASVALLLDWLGALGIAATPYIPDRLEEGYGPNEPAMTRLGATHDLVICVDCGTVSHGPVAAARQAGADVLILDHHIAGETLPEGATVVNPNRHDDGSGQGHLCAAGVVFLLLVAANRLMRARGGETPDLMALLDLVAVATVADVAPMLGLNRAFVLQGLAVMGTRGRPGLAALADVAGLSAPPTARDLGFALGPRINAGGRVGAADTGLRLLATRCPHEAAALAERLDALNAERRRIEGEVLSLAREQIEARDPSAPLVWAAGEGWHPGVVGIVASRLKDRYDRPAIVIGMAGGEGRGSGRSVPGLDLGSEVAALARAGLLLKGGGHAMAAGLSVAPEGIKAAMEALSERIAARSAGAEAAGPRELRIDGVLAARGATPEIVETLEAAGPFGPANPAPRLAFADLRLTALREVGSGGHLSFRAEGPGGGRIDGIAFRVADGPLGAVLEEARRLARPVHLAGRLELDDWGGRRRAKLHLEDAALP